MKKNIFIFLLITAGSTRTMNETFASSNHFGVVSVRSILGVPVYTYNSIHYSDKKKVGKKKGSSTKTVYYNNSKNKKSLGRTIFTHKGNINNFLNKDSRNHNRRNR